ncbi:MAG: hypothetical protein M3Q55_08390 [Acidobacteriota bacterium]|nr:hypothetical protein [Acidobacteriota bacterium]
MAVSVVLICAGSAIVVAQDQRPTFSTRVELLAIDVSALAEDGTPVEGLTPGDFSVRIDGVERRVVSADFLRLDQGAADDTASRRISDNRDAKQGGRFVVVVIDDASFLPGDEKAPIAAVMRFIEKLRPADRVGLALTSSGALSMPTTDREGLKAALGRIAGGWDLKPELTSGSYLGLSEAMDIALGNRNVFVQAVARICQRTISSSDVGLADACIEELENGARRMLDDMRQSALTRTSNISALLRALAGIDGQKSLVLVSAGLMLPGDLDPVQQIAALAPAANATLHTIYVDNTFASDARQQSPQLKRAGDVSASMNGLSTLAGLSRGTFQRLVGAGAGVFDRLTREMSAVYRLGIDASPADFDGQPHRLEVRSSRDGTLVRAHRHVVGTRTAEAGNAEAQLKRAIRAADPDRGVPARLTHFAFPGDQGRVRVVLAGEATPTAPGPASAMYHVMDGQGRVVDSRLVMAIGGEERAANTPMLVHADLMLPPGAYAAKLAVLDAGGSVGAVEHRFIASLTGTNSLALGDVTFFPAGQAEMLAPRDTLTAASASFTAYVEVAGKDEGDPLVTLELVDKAGATLMSNDVPLVFEGAPSKAGAKSEFSLLNIAAGEYEIVASLWRGDAMIAKVSTPVTVAPRAEEPSAAPGSTASTPAALVGRYVSTIAPVFDRGSMLRADVAAAVAKQVQARAASGAAAQAFTAGLRAFEQGRAEEAAVKFRAALAADPEFSPALFYLAACYALGGRDDEAAGAWQTSLGTAPETPMVYVQLADALLRQRRAVEARAFVDEGLDRWPADSDLLWRRMLVDAAEGKAVDAVALTAMVAARPDLVDARFMLVATLYERRNAAVGTERARLGVELRPHAEAYIAAGGAQAALVRRWLSSVR